MKFEWDSSEYKSTHGRNPSGVGSWAFEVPSFLDTELEQYAVPQFVSPSLSLSEAKKEFSRVINAEIRARGLEEVIAEHLGGVIRVTICT